MTVDDIGAKIAEIRASVGLSRERFAQVLRDAGFETTSGTILNLELGRTSSADVFLLLAVAKVGGITLAELLGQEASQGNTDDARVRRFRVVLGQLPEAEVESHLRALELLAQERRATATPTARAKRAA